VFDKEKTCRHSFLFEFTVFDKDKICWHSFLFEFTVFDKDKTCRHSFLFEFTVFDKDKTCRHSFFFEFTVFEKNINCLSVYYCNVFICLLMLFELFFLNLICHHTDVGSLLVCSSLFFELLKNTFEFCDYFCFDSLLPVFPAKQGNAESL